LREGNLSSNIKIRQPAQGNISLATLDYAVPTCPDTTDASIPIIPSADLN